MSSQRVFREQWRRLFGVTCFCCAISIEVVSGPEDPARDEVQVPIVGNGVVVVANRIAENAGFASVNVRPRRHDIQLFVCAVFVVYGLFASSDGFGGVEHFHIVVEFFFERGPVGKILGKHVFFLNVRDADWFLGAVTAGLQAQVFKPEAVGCPNFRGFARAANAIAVHGAM